MFSMKRWMMITVSAALMALLLIGVAAPQVSAHGPNGDSGSYGHSPGYGWGMGGGIRGGHMMGWGNTPGQGYGMMDGSDQGFGQMPGWGQPFQQMPGYGQGRQLMPGWGEGTALMPGFGMQPNYGYGMSRWGNNSRPGYGLGFDLQSNLNRLSQWWNRISNVPSN